MVLFQQQGFPQRRQRPQRNTVRMFSLIYDFIGVDKISFVAFVVFVGKHSN